jgi:hypothetical protein
MKNIPFLMPLSVAQARKIQQVVNQVIERDRRRCQMCGADETMICPYRHKMIVLFVATTKLEKSCKELTASELTTVCSTCASGLRALAKNPIHPTGR